MKVLRILFCSLFFIILSVPLITFNTKEDAVSEIDNKMLAKNPLKDGLTKDTLQDDLEVYISERIGFRDQMILGYTVANDVLFQEMVHPSYMYGKDGYVFFKVDSVKQYTEFEDAFVHMLCQIQQYCEDRSIPFVFVFEPSKASVLSDKLPDGYQYNNDWVRTFLQKLEDNHIPYVDNTETMRQCVQQGITVFNQKYNAGHWNDTGAFYGMNALMDHLLERGVPVHKNTLDEYSIREVLNTSLPVSQFLIHEYADSYSLKNRNLVDLTAQYKDEILLNPHFTTFFYEVNPIRQDERATKALVFQGSYLNGMGYKFLENSFGEYIAVHDYQNILNYDYYINIFQPECVIFDAAEYTFSDYYFDYNGMLEAKSAPLLSTFDSFEIQKNNGKTEIESKAATTIIRLFDVNANASQVYLVHNGIEYVMQKKTDDAIAQSYYEVTLNNVYYLPDLPLDIILVDTSNQIKYVIDSN